MPCLSASELLNLWEQAYSLPPARRAIEIVRAAHPQHSWTEIACWPIGYRDRQIARIRAELFSCRVPSVSNCPACQAPVEFDVRLDQCFQLQAVSFDLPAEQALPSGVSKLRPLTTADVIEHLERGRDESELLHRCVTYSDDDSRRSIEPYAVAEQLELLDPEARIEFSLCCPDCGQNWSSLFDIVTVFWIDLNTWARRMMQEIHQLAARYGWSEAEILSISPWRRAIYLNMTGAR